MLYVLRPPCRNGWASTGNVFNPYWQGIFLAEFVHVRRVHRMGVASVATQLAFLWITPRQAMPLGISGTFIVSLSSKVFVC